MRSKIRNTHIIESLKTREIQAKLIKNFIFFGYLPLGVTVALLTPDNILDCPWARAYTDFMASWLPYVAEVGRWTKVPATQFIAAVMNLVAMLCSFSMIYVQKRYLVEINERLSKLPKKKQLFVSFIGLPLWLLGSYILLFYSPIANPPDRRDRIMIGSNLGMGIYGSLIIAAAWFGAATVVIAVLSYFDLLKHRFKDN